MTDSKSGVPVSYTHLGAYRLTYIAGALHEIYFTLEPGALGWVDVYKRQGSWYNN